MSDSAQASSRQSSPDESNAELPPTLESPPLSATSLKTIGNFPVLGCLGKGGFASVYLAQEPALDRLVAIKVPHDEYRHVLNLRQEAKVTAGLSHAGIVKVIGVFPPEDTAPEPSEPPVYLVMEFINGPTLAERMKTRLELDYCVEILITVSKAVGHAHQHEIYHRDLKPQNILLDKEGCPHVSDFGLAIRQVSMQKHLGSTAGTPGYMAPEQLRGEKIGNFTDIWSLGVILYEMLTGELPFGRTYEQTYERVLKEEPRSPCEIDGSLPAELAEICLRCLRKAPEERYQTAEEVARDLQRWQARRAVGPADTDFEQAEAYYHQAYSHLDDGDYTTAIKLLEQVVQLNPDYFDAYCLLGLCKILGNAQIGSAIIPLQRAVELNPNQHEAHYLLAHICFAADQVAQARLHADKAVDGEPGNQLYRKYQQKLKRQSESVGSVQTQSTIEIPDQLDPVRRQQISEAAEEVLQQNRSRQLTLRHWTEFHFPWRWIRARPLVGATLFCLVGMMFSTLVGLTEWDGERVIRWSLIWMMIWQSLAYPFLVARMVEKMYLRLASTVNMPEDSFRRFFIRQASWLLGGSCALEKTEEENRWAWAWKYYRPQILITLLTTPLFLLFQLYCVPEPFLPLTVPRLILYTIAVVEVVLMVSWAFSLALLSTRFIPRFANIPVRYYLGMPTATSLASIGTFFVRLSWLSLVGFICFILQHYLYRTHAREPAISILYIVISTGLVVCVVLITQFQLFCLLQKLKSRKLLEYSYHVESSFDRMMKKPTEKHMEELDRHQQFMQRLGKLSTKTLTKSDLLQFLIIVGIFACIASLYCYLVSHQLWLM